MPALLLDLAVWAGGALALLLGARGLGIAPSRATAILYLLLSVLPWSEALLTPGHQVATDIPYLELPWSATPNAPVRAENPLVSDQVLLMLPFRTLVRERLLAGELPFWSHEMGTGQPLLGNGQAAPFAPLHLLALPLPPLRAMTVAVAWQTLLALLLVHGLLRDLGLRPAAAAFGATTYAGSTFLFVWAYYPLGMAAAWLPGVALGVHRICRDRPRGIAVLTAAAAGMALSGHPETLFHAALGALLLAVVLLRREPTRGRQALRLTTATTLAFLLSAPALLPILEAIPESERFHRLAATPAASFQGPRSPESLLFALAPLRTGSPLTGDWKGPGNFAESASHFAGRLPLAAGLAALVVGPRLPIVAGFACLLAAAGPLAPLVDALPVLEQTANGRLRLFWILALAVAAASVLDRLDRPGVRRALVASSVAVVLGAAAATPELSARASLATGVGALLFVLVLIVPIGRRLRLPLALVLTAAELAAVGVPYNPVLPPGLDLRPTPVLAHLEQLRTESSTPSRLVAEGWSLLANTAASLDLWDVRGYDPMRPFFPAELVRLRLGGPASPPEGPVLVPPDRADPAASLLGVRHRLTPPHRRRMREPWRLVGTFPGARLWENREARELFFVPRRVVAVDDRGEAFRRMLRHPAPHHAAPVEGLAAASAPAARQRGEARIEGVTANGFRLHVLSPAGVVVASSVSWAPGWVTDDPEVEVLRSGGSFLALGVPPGERGFSVHYRPVTWRPGLLLFAAGVLLVTGSAVLRRRRSPTSDGSAVT